MIFFQVLYSDTAPLIRHSQIPPLDSSDSESEIEPQPSGDEHSSSDDSGSTLIVLSSDVDTEVQSSPQSSSAQSSIAPTPVTLG